jgi:glycolate oxidase FAD binding subunit
MDLTVKVRDPRDVEEAVASALASDQPLEIVGHGTRRAIGHAMATNAVLDLSALDGVVAYEPSELVLTAQAGVPLVRITQLLAEKNQELAFEPMNVASLLGTPREAGTLGGVVASGLSGPRRIKAGAVRDHILGLSGVSGFGESFKAGGRVVKNVTGYDLSKLIAGSWGTLAVMTEISLKVLPRAEHEVTLVLSGLDDVTAGRAMTAAIGSPFEVSSAAHGLRQGDAVVTLFRLEGIAASVAHRARSLAQELQAFGTTEDIAGPSSAQLWGDLRDVVPFAASGPRGTWPVWRIVCPPAAGTALGHALVQVTAGEALYDWAGGLIWLAVPPTDDGGAALVRAQARRAGGHATLIRASDAVRAAIDVFEPLPGALGALHERVRASFDPQSLFNRGRMRRETAR